MPAHPDQPDGHQPTPHGYPRPQLRRDPWWSLNGPWDYAIDAKGSVARIDRVEWQGSIQVPFTPETEASGVGNTGFYRTVWYRKQFEAPPLKAGERVMLHFGAVDHAASVWVNDRLVGTHVGGYTPFAFDITLALRESGSQTVVVRADDDPFDLAKPRGKQDWHERPHSIWYPRSTGIWQTVWLERVPRVWIDQVRWTPNLHRWELDLGLVLKGDAEAGLQVNVVLEAMDRVIANDRYSVVAQEVHRRIALSDPGIDDYRNELLWFPTSPRLIQARIELRDGEGAVIDVVHTYTALRAIDIQGDRVILNGRPYYLRLVLDQGYWPDTGISTPSDDALRKDVELVKAMGFNGVRRHQVVSDPRYLYWADRLGLLVWAEMPSAYRFTSDSVQRLTEEWMAVIRRDFSHPCIMAWVPFNESWGVPDLPDSSMQRHYVQSLYHLTRTLDPTRPVIGNDGWESVATDILGIHDYDDDPDAIARRYGTEELSRLFNRERPGGRQLLINQQAHAGQPIVLSEFGGISLATAHDKPSWGYSTAKTPEDLAGRYEALLKSVHSLPMLAGFCYTQFADTYQETNGLLFEDRTPKFPLQRMAAATGGKHLMKDLQFQMEWRERLMSDQWHQHLSPNRDHLTQT